MSTHLARLRLTLALALAGLVAGLPAATTASPATVVAVQVRGTVEVQHGQSAATEAVTEGAQLGADDTITTAAQSGVMLVLPSGTVVTLKEKTRLKIATALHSPVAAGALAANAAEPRESGSSQTTFELAYGEMLTRVRKLNPTSTFTVQTPVSVAAVRGTIFEVAYQPDNVGEASYRLSTSSGLVQVTPHGGQMVSVPADEQVEFTAELGRKEIRIKHLKKGKLDRRKREQLEKEARDNEHTASDLVQKAQAARAKALDRAKADDPRGQVNERGGKPATPPKPPVRPKTIKRPPRHP
ncbi:MAG: FecR domain-containing protein [Opitutaceae bacterium]|nr:FecR domain-containing protein [Opitutaceae bacterium]